MSNANTLHLSTYVAFTKGAANQIQWPKFYRPGLKHLLPVEELRFMLDVVCWLLDSTPQEDRTFMLAVVMDIISHVIPMQVLEPNYPIETKTQKLRLHRITNRIMRAVVMHHAPPEPQAHLQIEWSDVRCGQMLIGIIKHPVSGEPLVNEPVLEYDFARGTYSFGCGRGETTRAALDGYALHAARDIEAREKHLTQVRLASSLMSPHSAKEMRKHD